MNAKSRRRAAISLLAAAAVATGAFAFYESRFFTYSVFLVADMFPSLFIEERSVSEGSLYGFAVGSTKEDALKALNRLAAEGHAYIDVAEIAERDIGPLAAYLATQEQVDTLRAAPLWIVYLQKQRMETLTIHFADNVIGKIDYRNQSLELP